MNKDYFYYQVLGLVNMYKIIARHISTIDVTHLHGVPLLQETMWY